MKTLTALFEESKSIQPMDNGGYVRARASEVLSRSGIHLIDKGQWMPLQQGTSTLLGVAFYSLLDLQLLDALMARVSTRALDAKIAIFDVLTCKSMDDFERSIPGIGNVYQTPVIGIWENGILTEKASGANARKVAEERYGL